MTRVLRIEARTAKALRRSITHVFLGHRRLAIIDLVGGHYQPMPNEDHSVLSVIFNGEIYNHAALRKELIARAYRSLSDRLFGYRSSCSWIRRVGRRSSRATQWYVCNLLSTISDASTAFLARSFGESFAILLVARLFAPKQLTDLEHPLASRSPITALFRNFCARLPAQCPRRILPASGWLPSDL